MKKSSINQEIELLERLIVKLKEERDSKLPRPYVGDPNIMGNRPYNAPTCAKFRFPRILK